MKIWSSSLIATTTTWLLLATVVEDVMAQNGAGPVGASVETEAAEPADPQRKVGSSSEGDSDGAPRGPMTNSSAGHFVNDGGYGIWVEATGASGTDHGAYISSSAGYGVLVQSASNQAVRGEAGDIGSAASTQPSGNIGVVGIGSSRGVYGGSQFGTALYGLSENNYGVWGQSTAWRGLTGRTDRTDNNYGIYTPDNFFSANVSLLGTVTQIMENAGAESLVPGDVVLFSGVNRDRMMAGSPIVQVSKSNRAGSPGLAGVVAGRYNIEALDGANGFPDGSIKRGRAMMEVTSSEPAAVGEHVLVVIQGPAMVSVADLGREAIQPGDLVSSGRDGRAGRADLIRINDMEFAAPGTVLGKALEPFDDATEKAYIYVTLQ